MYQAIYKCRLCNEIIKDRIVNTKQSAEIHKLADMPSEPLHDCTDGSFGILELQGFKKVGD